MDANTFFPQSTKLSQRDCVLLTAYLSLSEWTHRSGNTWREYSKKLSGDSSEVSIVLPLDFQQPDAFAYAKQGVEVLSALSSEDYERTLFRVRNVFSDLLMFRNLETAGKHSITLKLANIQISRAKALVNTASRLEREPKAHYLDSPSDELSDEIHFGHTFYGSFGMRLESPILPLTDKLFGDTKSGQQVIFPDQVQFFAEQVISPPRTRRVLERIARGLRDTSEAAEGRTSQLLERNFEKGFNANTCQQLSEIVGAAGTVEIEILWSPKVSVAKDVSGFSSVRLSNRHKEVLDQAREVLRTTNPEWEKVRGRVFAVRSDEDPHGDVPGNRIIEIRQAIGRGRRTRAISVPLTSQQYRDALHAHSNWLSAEAEGILERTSEGYLLRDVRKFRVIPKDELSSE